MGIIEFLLVNFFFIRNQIHSGMSHIVYYMSTRSQPAIFRHAANSAFQLAVADAVALSAMTKRHYHAIGLVNDSSMSQGLYEWKKNFK
jgi:hypothetical protein